MPKLKVKRMFIMPSGDVKAEHELTSEEIRKFHQKVVDALAPLAYEAVISELKNELKRKN